MVFAHIMIGVKRIYTSLSSDIVEELTGGYSHISS